MNVEPTPRILLLRGDDHHNLYLDSLLRSTVNVCAVVVESGLDQRRALRRRDRWIDAVAAEYHHLRRKILGKDRYRARFFANALRDSGLSMPPPADLFVQSINDPAVGKLASDLPDFFGPFTSRAWRSVEPFWAVIA